MRKRTNGCAKSKEYVDPNDFPPPPAPNQIEPIVPAIPPPLAVFDEFDYFPEPQPASGPEGAPEWTEYIAGLAVGADQVQSAIKKPRVEPPEDDNALFRPRGPY